MFLKFFLAGPPARRRKGLLGGLALILAAGPALILAQGETDYDAESLFLSLSPNAPASQIPGAPPLPPSVSDPFALPPEGSIPLGSAVPPLTSPAAPQSAPTADPFGTPPPENRQVRQLGPAVAPPETQAPAPAPEARQTKEDAQRAQLRALFPDMLTPEAPPVPPAQAAQTPPASAQAATPPAKAAPAPAKATPAPSKAAPAPAKATPAPAKATPAPAKAAPAPAKAVPAPAAQTPAPQAAAQEDPPPGDDWAIGRAGALLTQEAYGQAKILPPLDLPPAQPTAKPATEPEIKAPVKPGAKPEAKPAAKPEAKPEAKPAAKPEAKPAAKQEAKPAAKPVQGGGTKPGPAAPRGSLALVNQTGDPQVGTVYQSALSRLGYTILPGPAAAPGPGPAGQTVIYYRPGAISQAQAVSRDLPGRKVLAETSSPGAAADIVVVLR